MAPTEVRPVVPGIVISMIYIYFFILEEEVKTPARPSSLTIQTPSSSNLNVGMRGDQALLDAAEQGNIEMVKSLVETHKDDPMYVNGSDRLVLLTLLQQKRIALPYCELLWLLVGKNIQCAL